MKLSLEQIKSVTQGAVRIWEQDGGVALSRFTEAEDALYAESQFFILRFASAGIHPALPILLPFHNSLCQFLK